MQRRERIARERMLFDSHVVQALAARGVVAPLAPGRKKIEPQSEPGFKDGEIACPGPPARQTVALEEYVARLSGAGIAAVIDVAVAWRVGRSIAVKGECGGFDAHAMKG